MSKAADLANLIGNINAGGGRTNRNLVINGAMNVAQRGTSSTGTGYQTVDRFQTGVGGTDESPTQAQVDIASSATPYTLGFRKAFKVTNGNQTSGAGTSDIIDIKHIFEAQNIATSGWNFTSSDSVLSFSFWVKSSVAQNFFGHIKTFDGTVYNYPFSTGVLTADTWTKVTKTIPGNSNLTINNDNGQGLEIRFLLFAGTNYTASVSEDAWVAYDNTQRSPDNTSTWYTTNDATFEITGVQLELGQNATEFEHEPFERTLARCQRYYAEKELHQTYMDSNADSAQYLGYDLPVEQRADGTGSVITQVVYWSGGSPTNVTPNVYPKTDHIRITTSSLSSSRGMVSGRIASDAEL